MLLGYVAAYEYNKVWVYIQVLTHKQCSTTQNNRSVKSKYVLLYHMNLVRKRMVSNHK